MSYRYLQSSSAEDVTRDMSSAVSQGLKAGVKAGLKRAADQAEETRGLLRMDLQGGEVRFYGGESIVVKVLTLTCCGCTEISSVDKNFFGG